MDCPKCQHVQLVHCQNEFGNFWHCDRCEGTAVTLPLLRRLIGRDTVNALWQGARQWEHPERCQCPGCHNRMEEVPISTPVGRRHIDVCSHCQFIWLDAGERDDLPHAEVEAVRAPPELPMKVREKLAVERIEQVREAFEADATVGPHAFWQWIPALLGMPLETRQPNEVGRAWMTWITAAFITVLSLLAFIDLDAVIAAYGLIPAEWDRLGGLTFLTSFFLHAGVLHLIGNLYFLWVFGDNTECELGSGAFFGLLMVAALAGDLLHIALDPQSSIPCVGASGGISGVIAFYALRFPKSRLSLLHFFFFYPVWLRMRAIWAFGFWILLQFLIAWLQSDGLSDVSGAAHIGGALVGMLAWFAWRIGQPDQPEKLRDA